MLANKPETGEAWDRHRGSPPAEPGGGCSRGHSWPRSRETEPGPPASLLPSEAVSVWTIVSSRCSAWGRFVTRGQRTDTAPRRGCGSVIPGAPAGLGLRSSGCPCGSGAPDGIAPAAAVPPPHSPLRGHPWVSPSPRAQSWGHAQGRTAGRCLLTVTEAGHRAQLRTSTAPASSQPLCVSEPRLFPLRAQMPGPGGLTQAALLGKERLALSLSMWAQPASCLSFPWAFERGACLQVLWAFSRHHQHQQNNF